MWNTKRCMFNYEDYDTPEVRRRRYLDPEDCNKGNNCSKYEPVDSIKMWFRKLGC